METLTFANSAEFRRWAEQVVQTKDGAYNRVPIPPQIWSYGDGYSVPLEHGKRGGTMLSNLAFMLRTSAGKLEHESDARVVSDIDTRNGVTITINWGENDSERS